VIPTQIKIILTTWAVALFLFVGLFSLWQWRDRQDARRQSIEERAAMCRLITTIIGDTAPPEGPAGARAREVRADLLAYQNVLHCPAATR
jgi:hypothetical protein